VSKILQDVFHGQAIYFNFRLISSAADGFCKTGQIIYVFSPMKQNGQL